MSQLTTWAQANPALAITSAVLAVLALTLAYLATRKAGRAITRTIRRIRESGRTEDALTYLAAGIATAVAATGMWTFFDHEFPDLHTGLRALLFAFIELAVITSAVRARRNMRERHSAGIDGMAVWALTGLSAVLSAMEAQTVGAMILRLSAPLVAAWLWERGMAVERVRLTGRPRIAWKLTPARLAVALGLADPTDRDASEVAVHRYLTRVALAANAVRDLPDDAKPRTRARALRRLRKAMNRAVEYAGLAGDPGRITALIDQLRLLYNTEGLAGIPLSSPWEAIASGAARPSLPAAPPEPPDDDPGRAPRPVPDAHVLDRAALAALPSKRAKIRHAFASIGEADVPRAVEWLAERGVHVSRGDAYAVRKADQDRNRAATLRAVES